MRRSYFFPIAFIITICFEVMAQTKVLNSTFQFTKLNSCSSDAFNPTTETEADDLLLIGRGDTVYSHIKVSEKIETLDIIVQFQIPPIAAAKVGLAKAAQTAAMIKAEHTSFLEAVRLAETKLQSSTKAILTNTEIKSEFNYAFNGIVLRTDSRVLQEISQLPMVKSVHRDEVVRECLDESVPWIGADQVWKKFGFTGKGVVVSVIDGGIDYKHPALGGNIGPQYKVIGGYDFVDQDVNPMDDERGHGTHVAGIIAANSDSLKGVAPDAQLLAYKVIDRNGEGLESNVIAAIERSLNPDGLLETDDQADVINLSLGFEGDPMDPLCVAVNNAVRAGTMVVVAAGNDGAYQTINSPANAAHAISVTAAAAKDDYASFNSMGPTKLGWELKPDVLAPGVFIRSTFLGKSWSVKSGTSMAAPHVAGLVALLKQKYPSMDIEMLKALVLESSKDLGLDVCMQGNGRVDAIKAFTLGTVLLPAKVNFGPSDLTKSVWQISQALQLFNVSGTPQEYQLTLESQLPAGVDVQLTRSRVLLNPSQSAQFQIKLAVNNALVPYLTKLPGVYEGKIRCCSVADTVTIPFGFFKLPILHIELDRDPVMVYIFNKSYFMEEKIDWLKNKTADLIAPEGKFDLLVVYQGRNEFILKENIEITKSMSMEIKKEEAINELDIRCLDNKGRPLPFMFYAYRIRDSKSGFFFASHSRFFLEWEAGKKKSFTNLSRNYRFDTRRTCRGENGEYFEIPFTFRGLTKDTLLVNSPDQFKHVTQIYHFDSPQPQITVKHLLAAVT